MSEQDTSGPDPATATSPALGEEIARLRDGLPAFTCPACGAETRARLTDTAQLEEIKRLLARVAELEADRDSFAEACRIHYERLVEARALVADLEAQRAKVLALCDAAERHAGTARFGYLNEDDVRAALAAPPDPAHDPDPELAEVIRELKAGPQRDDQPADTVDVADCPFCAIAVSQAAWCPGCTGDPDDHPDGTVVFPPLDPVTPGHLLVIPRRHVGDATEDPYLTAQVMKVAAEVARGHDACNLITSIGEVASQTVRHLHIHVVPRRPGDGLALPWTNQHREGS